MYIFQVKFCANRLSPQFSFRVFKIYSVPTVYSTAYSFFYNLYLYVPVIIKNIKAASIKTLVDSVNYPDVAGVSKLNSYWFTRS